MRGLQVRAARQLLQLSQQELADLAGIAVPTLRDIENEAGDPKRSSIRSVEEALRDKGIVFADVPGVIGNPPAPPSKGPEEKSKKPPLRRTNPAR